MSNSIKNKAASGVIWVSLERFGAQGVNFIVSIVLARLLLPEDYGTVALAMVFTDFLAPFINCGLGSALIQKKEPDELDFSTYFIFNMFMSIALYILLFFFAPFVASFYNNSQITLILRVIGLNLIIYGVKNVQQNYVNKRMLFKTFFFSTAGGTIGAAVVGIVMAYMGFGVWAIVCQNLFNNLIDTIILWITVKWRPHFHFSFSRLKFMWKYGWKILAVNIANTIESKVRSLVIGKVYSSKDLAFYNKGNLFPDTVVTTVDSTINSVLFPAFSTVQDDKEAMKSMLKRSIKTSIYIIAPLNFGLAACSTALIRLLLTEKWLPCVPFMMFFCVAMVFVPINTGNLNALKALGRSDVFLKIDIIKKSFSILALFVCMSISGIMGIAYSTLIARFFEMLINTYYTKKFIGYGFVQQIKDSTKGVLLSVIMAIPVYCIGFIGLNDFLTLFIQVLFGVIIYIVLSIITKCDDFYYLLDTVRSLIKQKKGKER